MSLATFLCRLSLTRGGECEFSQCLEGGKYFLRCIHCGLETIGIDLTEKVADVPGTAPYYMAALDEMLEAELELHYGG